MLLRYVYIFLILYILARPGSAVFQRASIVNGTSAVFDNVTSNVNIYDTTGTVVIATTPIPALYNFSSQSTIYPYWVSGYVAYSFNTMKRAVSFGGNFNSLICGTADRLQSSGNKYSTLVCTTFNDTCATYQGNGVQIYQLTNLSYPVYSAVPPRAFLSSQTPTGLIPLLPPGNTNAEIWVSRLDVGMAHRFVQFHFFNTTVPFVTYDKTTTTLPTGTYLVYQPYHDYSVSGTKMIFTYFAISPTFFFAYTSTCTGSGCGLPTFASISGYNLLNHYTYANGMTAPVPVFVLANSTSLVLATLAVAGDMALVNGLRILTAAPIVGCTPDSGTMINWNNTANPYPNTVHLYTLCVNSVTNTTVPSSGAVYEINVTPTTLTFSRWQTVSFNSAVGIQVIGEYGHILTTTDATTTPPLSMNVGLYSLYDPFNPQYIGYATLSQGANVANTVNSNFFFSISADVSRYSCGTNAGHYLTSQLYSGINLATLQFCGSGNPQYNNATYCDGYGRCCTDYCQVRPANYTCNAGNVSTCSAALNCTGTAANCPAATSNPNGTWCGTAPGVCYQNNTCYGGTCYTSLPFPNGTIITPATLCQTAFYCDGAGNLVGGVYLPPSTLCSAGNVTYCVQPSYCTGSSATCPANTYLPDGSNCGVFQGVCYYNNTCLSGICELGGALPNGTIIFEPADCKGIDYCDGYGNLVNSSYSPPTEICRPGNVSLCIADAYCDGVHHYCPNSTAVPDGTVCVNITGNSCQNSTTCSAGVCNVTNVAVNGTTCPKTAPCAETAVCLSGQCQDEGIAPANTECDTPDNIPVGVCSLYMCNGIDTVCHVSPSDEPCVLHVSPQCNITGQCILGNCVANTTCATPAGALRGLGGISFSAPGGTIAGVVVAMFVVAVIFVLYWYFYFRFGGPIF